MSATASRSRAVPRRPGGAGGPEFDWAIAGLRQSVEEARPLLHPGDHRALWLTERLTRVSPKHLDKRFAWLRSEAGLDRDCPTNRCFWPENAELKGSTSGGSHVSEMANAAEIVTK